MIKEKEKTETEIKEKRFFDIFNKYQPTQKEKNILNAAYNIKIYADREARIIDVNLNFDSLIEKDFLHDTEEKIREVYNLNKMSFKPKYKKELFCEEYFAQIIAEAKRLTANVWFLKDSEIKLNRNQDNKIIIELAHGGKNYLEEAAKFIDLLKKIIASEFDFSADIELGGVTALYKNDAGDIANAAFNIAKIETEAAREMRSARAAAEEAAAEESPGAQETQREKIEKIRSKSNGLPEAESEPETDGDLILKIDFGVQDYAFVKSNKSNSNRDEIVMPGDILPIKNINADIVLNPDRFIVTYGKIYDIDSKDMRRTNKKSATIKITDYRASILVKIIDKAEAVSEMLKKISKNDCVIISGEADYSEYDDEIIINPESLIRTREVIKKDTAEKKRIELHLHTTMSSMDATVKPEELIKYAYETGHRAVAVTDHGNVQAFPEIMNQKERLKLKDGESFKVIYGSEGYMTDDSNNSVFGKVNANLGKDEFVIFDIETTGLSPNNCGITEIGAVKIKAGEITGEFNTFVNPGMDIPANITQMTGISNETVKDAPKIKEALKNFFEFAGNNMLVAHNASFDMGFIRKYAAVCKYNFANPHLDTLAMSRSINKDLKNHRLDTLVNFYKIKDFEHHRACDDARALAAVFMYMTEQLKTFGVSSVFEMNEMANSYQNPTNHVILLVKNSTGLKNLYKIISESYTEYFYKRPRIPRSVLERYREGLIVGSACEAGELFAAVTEGKKDAELKQIAKFYDYLEVQPTGNNMFLVHNGTVQSEEELKRFNRKIIELGEKLKKPVVATGDVHFLRKSDEISRKILLKGMKFPDADRDIPLYYRTTEEMLGEFSYLPKEKAYEIVVENTNKIADMTDPDISPVPRGSYTPEIDGAKERLRESCYKKARELYKEPLPVIVEKRIEKELGAIIGNGFAVLYAAAIDLVAESEKQGYLVGSRGSVGSSLAASLSGITEVNPLPPHYYCKNQNCAYTAEFIADGSYGSGYDLPEKNCPDCGEKLEREGQDIPFETFMGFDGDKAPDIDLNFSGTMQVAAHRYTEELFGRENVFRAGTIGALAGKTAYGFVKNYLGEKNISLNKAHTDWLVSSCVGVKRTTGQHPGGMIVIPKECDIYDFTPVQYPANDAKSGIVTTHFPYDYLEGVIQKLDLLGHDVPTKYKILKDMTGIDVRELPMNDKNVMELFSSTKSIGVNPSEIDGGLGTYGIPEVGTKFVRQMIAEAKPSSFADLLQISGLSHGTGVWLGNARELIKNKTCDLSEVIGIRDNIMLYLIQKGVDPSLAFAITESVRKGRGLKTEWEKIMLQNNIPEWYIESCNKIEYMFPKAHASAYMIAAMRLGWFKVYRPLEFYASYFTVQPEGMDAELAASGRDSIRRYIEETEKKGNEATQKENEVVTAMLLVLEMYARNIRFLPVDIYKSAAFEYKIEDGKIRLPFSSLAGVGENAAENIAAFRDEANGEIFSVEDVQKKAKLTKTAADILKRNKVFGDIPETDQISLF
ncbi:MAG: PolC-type DNA polymerase III [Oscillospiraceae bacterium]|nr:PolC-type DNA polymerase III [Oscillospiraceae bacterium]